MYVYCLISTDRSTYIGATVDLHHRIRQHNKELVGGARQTSRKVVSGQSWTCYCYVEGFPDWQACLQFEWRWKQLSRKVSHKDPLERRKSALETLLMLERPTTKALPYLEWSSPPHVVYPGSDPLPKRILQSEVDAQLQSMNTDTIKIDPNPMIEDTLK
jgi:predicted GIY-YIG superfamily endonuclease